MNNPSNATGAPGKSSDEVRYAPDEEQPAASSNEREALAEREDGTILAGKLPQEFPGGAPADAVPIIKLTADERQPVDEIAEYHALSEREDGTNLG
jgi:hypothetical protein